MFKNDALVYNNIDKVTINSNNSDMYVSLSFKDFPFVGIWSPYYEDSNSMAPFVCIEPWQGIADLVGSDYDFKNKFGINMLEVGQEFEASYTITVG